MESAAAYSGITSADDRTSDAVESIHKEWNENHPDALKSWKPTDEEEIYVCIHWFVDHFRHPIWSVNNGRRIVRSVMTENRFKNLLRFCRFDETTNTKAAQVKRDKRAAFRDIWTMFQTNLKNLYNLSAFLTDEKAEADFQPSNTNSIQTGKYWITIFWYCDAETSCPLAEEIDVGRQPGHKARMDVADLVKRIPLAEDLLSKKTTIVGTLRKNRKEAPSAK
ncbi:hypothetical protein T02_2794 [Trichinella nativa]|uniref:PiggyBac transposable element-derived protein domain-containing protein n=1 Tax=Trichinella nativa TaxID=6335 RepID=A0A0V1L767_9BILA|nr:hypothetical protein T02_2794 [Trichinella nativa]